MYLYVLTVVFVFSNTSVKDYKTIIVILMFFFFSFIAITVNLYAYILLYL